MKILRGILTAITMLIIAGCMAVLALPMLLFGGLFMTRLKPSKSGNSPFPSDRRDDVPANEDTIDITAREVDAGVLPSGDENEQRK